MNQESSPKAVCLFSGGLDSTTLLLYAKQQGFQPYALTIDYGQIHLRELESARQIAQRLMIPHQLSQFTLPWKGSSLLDSSMSIPVDRETGGHEEEIPSTYVPSRNIIFLSLAASYAEVIKAKVVFYGANSIDYSGYPDCRPDFVESFNRTLKVGTKAGCEGSPIVVQAPFVTKTKKQIIQRGMELGVPFEMTWSCYQGGFTPCGVCDSCKLRSKGFEEAGIKDPAIQNAASGNG